ncbi:ADP-ribosylation/Crystallin J1, partial [Streptomyces sp. SPB78]
MPARKAVLTGAARPLRAFPGAGRRRVRVCRDGVGAAHAARGRGRGDDVGRRTRESERHPPTSWGRPARGRRGEGAHRRAVRPPPAAPCSRDRRTSDSTPAAVLLRLEHRPNSAGDGAGSADGGRNEGPAAGRPRRHTMATTVSTAPAGVEARARGALLGLAVGDALGAPAENLKPSEIRRRWGRITGYVAERPAGTDDTEYALFSGLLLVRHGAGLTVAHAEAAWREWLTDIDEGAFRGAGFSERGTVENLRRGLGAPASAQHRHPWSDGLAMRAAPFGVYAAGDPAEAARLVAVDGAVSHEGEGIHGGQAVAAAVAVAMTGAGPGEVTEAALASVPADSWTYRSLRRALVAAREGERALRAAVVVRAYPWTDLAPEAVGLALGAYALAGGAFRTAVLAAVNMGRDADTTAAIAGALAGAAGGVEAILLGVGGAH